MSSSEDDDIIFVAAMLLLRKHAKRRRSHTDINPVQTNRDITRSSRFAVNLDSSRSIASSACNDAASSNQEISAVHPGPSSRLKVQTIPIRRVGPKSKIKERLIAGKPITIRRTISHKKISFVHPLKKDSDAVWAKLYTQLCDDEERFFKFTGMTKHTFEELLTLVHESIRKVDTNFRKSIWPRERLLLTLRFLVSGETSRSMHQQFQLGASTVQKITYEVCEALWEQLKDRELPKLTEASLHGIAQKFWAKWNYPHCLGTIDGKRIQIKCPHNSGIQYNNSFIVLQGVADAEGNFIAVDVGGDGKDSDIDVLKQSSFGQALYGNQIPIPRPDTHLHGDLYLNEPLPYTFAGNVGYPLLKNLMRPYPERGMDNSRSIYNFRHWHALRSFHCAFSMLTAKWGILNNCLQMNSDNATKVILACCVLHNFVRRREHIKEDTDEVRAPLENFDRNNRVHGGDQPKLTGRPCQEAIQCREKLAQLFISHLSIPGQDKAANVPNVASAAIDTSFTAVPSNDAVHAAMVDIHSNSTSTPIIMTGLPPDVEVWKNEFFVES